MTLQITESTHPSALSLGEWQANKSYSKASIVSYRGFYFVALSNNWNSPPSPGGGDKWRVMKDIDGRMVRKEEVVA